MTYRCFEVDVAERVAHIVLSRPDKRNSMIAEFWDELPCIVEEIDHEARARVIVISSTGPHFSSGLDVSAFGDGTLTEPGAAPDPHAARQRAASFYRYVQRMQRAFSSLEACRLPVLAAIQGGCIGGGVDLTTACDVRYASEDAFFTIFEINLALTADVGTFPRILRCMPEGLARELAYTGRRLSATEALASGLITRLYPDARSLLDGVLEIAHEIARKAPLAIYGTKRMLNYARDHSTADTLDYVSLWNAAMLQPEEIAEAMRANAEKREGDFAELPRLRRSVSGA